MILIVGDRHSIIEYAVESGVKLIILSGDAEIKDKHLEDILNVMIGKIIVTQDFLEKSVMEWHVD